MVSSFEPDSPSSQRRILRTPCLIERRVTRCRNRHPCHICPRQRNRLSQQVTLHIDCNIDFPGVRCIEVFGLIATTITEKLHTIVTSLWKRILWRLLSTPLLMSNESEKLFWESLPVLRKKARQHSMFATPVGFTAIIGRKYLDFHFCPDHRSWTVILASASSRRESRDPSNGRLWSPWEARNFKRATFFYCRLHDCYRCVNSGITAIQIHTSCVCNL